MLNHGPVVGVIVAFVLLIAGMVWRSQPIVRAALIGLAVVGLLAAVVARTGEAAEEQVEDLPGISETHVEAHEEAAEKAALGLEILGAAALLGLFAFRSRRTPPVWFALLLLLASAAAIAATVRTADLGGRIRHPEIRPDATAGTPDAGEGESLHEGT